MPLFSVRLRDADDEYVFVVAGLGPRHAEMTALERLCRDEGLTTITAKLVETKELQLSHKGVVWYGKVYSE